MEGLLNFNLRRKIVIFRFKNFILFFSLVVAFVLFGFGRTYAKFTCDVKSIEGNQMVLENCQEKGLKRLKPGDKVSIIKKRKSKKLEGC